MVFEIIKIKSRIRINKKGGIESNPITNKTKQNYAGLFSFFTEFWFEQKESEFNLIEEQKTGQNYAGLLSNL